MKVSKHEILIGIEYILEETIPFEKNIQVIAKRILNQIDIKALGSDNKEEWDEELTDDLIDQIQENGFLTDNDVEVIGSYL